jgi:hypothetical protein
VLLKTVREILYESLRVQTALYVAIVLLLLSTSCVEIDVTTKINENGSGTQQWRFSGTALLANEIKKHVQASHFFRNSILLDEFKEGDYILETSLNFKDISELRNVDRDVRFETKGFLLKMHSYTEVWKRTGQAAGLLAQYAGGLVPVTLKVAVDLPGQIIETNADSKEGSTARWTIPVSDLSSPKVLFVKSQSWNWPILSAGLLVMLAIFSGIVFVGYMYSRKRIPLEEQSYVSCASCGANVPSGSRYCNFCGKDMGR